MKTYVTPPTWSGPKFAVRYTLDKYDFRINGEGLLEVIPDFKITDNPPIFDPPDPPGPTKKQRLEAVKTLPELIALLKEIL